MSNFEIDSMMAFALGLGGASPSEIHDSVQKMNQQDMIVSTTLPKPYDDASKKDLEAMGVVWGEVVPRDSILFNVQLPKGWTKKSTNHYMYSDLLDENGFKRATIMFKGGFGDRDGWTSSETRLKPSYVKDDYDDRSAPYFPAIQDSNNNTLWRGAPMSDNNEARKKAWEVLTVAYPNWKSPTANWDLKTFDSLPPSESKTPPGKDYDLFTAIYRDGRHVDSGHSDTKRFESPEAAIKGYTEKAKKYIGGYDEVKFTITCEGKTIHTGSVSAQRRPSRRNPYTNELYDCDYRW